MQCLQIFSIPYPSLLNVNASAYVGPCFIRKNKIVQHINHFCEKKKKHFNDYRFIAHLVAKKPNQGRELVTNDSSENAGSVNCSWRGGGRTFLYPSFSVYTCLIVWLHLKLYSLTLFYFSHLCSPLQYLC